MFSMGDIVLDYYEKGLYTDQDMQLFIMAVYITQEQFDAVKRP